MQLTKNFTLEEFEKTDSGLPNSMPKVYHANAKFVAEKLQTLRDWCMFPIVIESGYRSIAVNKAVGGSSNSLHQVCLAVDIVLPSMSYNKMVYFLREVLKLNPFEIHFNSSDVMHISWLK